MHSLAFHNHIVDISNGDDSNECLCVSIDVSRFNSYFFVLAPALQ